MLWIVIILLIIVIFGVAMNNKGKNNWKNTIALIVMNTLDAKFLADGIDILKYTNNANPVKTASVYLDFLSGFIVLTAKGEQNESSFERDKTNVLSIIKNDDALLHLVYDRYTEMLAYFSIKDFNPGSPLDIDNFRKLIRDKIYGA